MPKTANDLPKLFRSLGQNDGDLRSANNTDSREAEQRWPLLKAMPPKEPQQTPALTAQEMQRWQPLKSNEQNRPNPPPSPSGLGDNLALGLKKMSTQANAESNRQEGRSQSTMAAPAPTFHRDPAAELTTGLKAMPTQTMPQMKKADAEGKVEVTLGAVLSKKDAAVEPTAPNKMPADDLLKSVFSRLEGHEKETKPSITAEKRPSYLGRLGRK